MREFKLGNIMIMLSIAIMVLSCTANTQAQEKNEGSFTQEYYSSSVQSIEFNFNEYESEVEEATGFFMMTTDFSMIGFTFDSENYAVDSKTFMSVPLREIKGENTSVILGKALDMNGDTYTWIARKKHSSNKIYEFEISIPEEWDYSMILKLK